MTTRSSEFARVFAAGPPTVQDQRPETDMEFLQWLAPREGVIHDCALKDIELRELNESTLQANPNQPTQCSLVVSTMDYSLANTKCCYRFTDIQPRCGQGQGATWPGTTTVYYLGSTGRDWSNRHYQTTTPPILYRCRCR